jgi:hypothetical protein
LIEQDAILTKDNMRKKNLSGDPGCYFCGVEETIDHLMFSCPVAKVWWRYASTKMIDLTVISNIGLGSRKPS